MKKVFIYIYISLSDPHGYLRTVPHLLILDTFVGPPSTQLTQLFGFPTYLALKSNQCIWKMAKN